jgi:PAS domain S-box-containing protein
MILQRTVKKILIVDDDLITRLQLNKILETHGYQVQLAENGHQCLEYLKKQRPKIILLDLVMPDLNGIEVCHRIKTDNRLKDIPVLMLTSASETKEKVSGFAAGADDYIVKPFVVEELMARIANHIKTANLVGRLKREVVQRKRAEIELEKAKTELETRVHMRTSELEFANEKLIQERQQLEQTQVALREREQRFKAVVNNIPGMVYKGHPDWSATVFSGCMALCGYSEKEINAREDNWLSVIHPDDREAIFEKGYLLSQEPQKIVQTYRIITKNGNICWVEDRKASLFSEKGAFLGIFGIVFDITARRDAEQKLLREKEKLEEALVKIKTLSGLLPICANCKKIRDDKGYWNQIENYITNHSDVLFSHSICPDCLQSLYPDINSDRGSS